MTHRNIHMIVGLDVFNGVAALTFTKYQASGKGRLCVMAKPSSGEWIADEFDAITAFGILRVVSVLEVPEAYSVGLSDEDLYCRTREIYFIQY